jgi:hypothetical protein
MGTPTRAGIGLRSRHVGEVIASRPDVGFYEVHAENYMGGGPALRWLQTIRRDAPVSLHGVGLSLGSAEGVDEGHLRRLAALTKRIEPFVVSEHLSWSTAGGAYLNDLLALPYTDESLAVVAAHVDRLQSVLRRQVLIENPSAYLRFVDTVIPEAEFLSALVRRTGCGILCDVNNIVVTTGNVGGDPEAWLAGLPAGAVGEIHLAGHRVNEVDGTAILIDDHGSPVGETVWRLYAQAVRRFPEAPTLIEWDTDIPELEILLAEARTADRVRAAALGGAGRAVAA